MKREFPDHYTPPTPAEIIAPGVGDARALTRSPVRSISSAADIAPQPPRPGSEIALACPSRSGDRLYHRDGRITDLAGKPIPRMEQTA